MPTLPDAKILLALGDAVLPPPLIEAIEKEGFKVHTAVSAGAAIEEPGSLSALLRQSKRPWKG